MGSFLLILAWAVGLTGCFRPAIPFSTQPNYPVDVFYENQRPERPFQEIQPLEYTEESPLATREQPDRERLRNRGNNMEQKELVLAKLTLQAKKLGADALINVRYQIYTTASLSGYRMSGVAVKYLKEETVGEQRE